MSQKTFTIIASAVFGVVALFHVLRIFFGWPRLGGTDVVKLDRSRRRRRLELLRNKPRHAWLRQRKQTAFISGVCARPMSFGSNAAEAGNTS
jgi:hypothetical protein